MSDTRDICANCGEFYEHHMKTTQCYPDSVDKWFPKKLADAITASRSTPKASVRGFDEKFDEWFDGFETFGLSLHDIAKAGAIQFMTARDVEKEM